MAKKPRPYRARLHDLTSVRQEAARLYRQARANAGDDLSVDASYKLGALLQIIAKLIEGADLEARLAEVERRTADRPTHPSASPVQIMRRA